MLDAHIAVLGKLAHERIAIDDLADGQLERAPENELRRRQPIQQRVGIDHEGAALAAREAMQGGQPLGEQVLRR